jgi:hypothetical protein
LVPLSRYGKASVDSFENEVSFGIVHMWAHPSSFSELTSNVSIHSRFVWAKTVCWTRHTSCHFGLKDFRYGALADLSYNNRFINQTIKQTIIMVPTIPYPNMLLPLSECPRTPLMGLWDLLWDPGPYSRAGQQRCTCCQFGRI